MVNPVHIVGRFGGRGQSIVNRFKNNDIANNRVEKSRQRAASSRTSSLSASSNPNAYIRFSLPVASTNTGNEVEERQIPLSNAYSLLSLFSSAPSFNSNGVRNDMPKLPKSLGNLKTSHPNNLNNRGGANKKSSTINNRNASSVIDGGESSFISTRVEPIRTAEETPDDIAQRQSKYDLFSQLDQKNGTNYASQFTNKSGNQAQNNFIDSTIDNQLNSSKAVEQAGGLYAYFKQQELFGVLNKQATQPILAVA